VVAVGPGSLEGWVQAVCEGGFLVLVDKGHPAVATRRALCAGLVDLEQRLAGKVVVTSGRLRRW
jgi:hypothetical protein